MSESNRRAVSPFERDVDAEAHRRNWERQRAPKTYAMLERCWKLLTCQLDPFVEGEIKGLIICLGPVARSGRDIDDASYWGDLEQEVLEMLERAEASCGLVLRGGL